VKHYPQDRIVVLDALTYAGNLASLESVSGHEQYRFVKGDIVDRESVEALLREEQIDTIVHFAAESHVDRSISGPAAFIDTNIVGTHNLLQAARSVWLGSDDAPVQHRFHHVSTDEVYGSLGPSDPGFSESTPYAPNSPYSASKAASDHLVRAYHHTYGMQVTTSNCSNNYGPYQFPEKLIPLMIVNALDGKPLPIYGDGSNIRDWLYVEDHVRGIDLVIKQGAIGETYNIGGNEERANIDIVNSICGELDNAFTLDPILAQRFPNAPAASGRQSSSLITSVKDRPGHDWRYAIDAERIKDELGFSPKYDFTTGLQKTITWMLDQEPWWRAVMDGSYRDWIDTHYDSG
jgi:dTDP-glucose 4,6-dehydratase